MSTAPAQPTVLHLSLVVGGVLRDRNGERLGKVDDLLVRLGEDYPPVTGVLASVAGRPVFVAAAEVAEIAHGRVDLLSDKIDLQRFERRYGEVLLRKDVLDRQLINVDGARLVRANEIEIARIDGWYRVVGVDTGLRGIVRRVAPRRLGANMPPGEFLDWASVEAFTGHVPTVRLRVPHPKLARLHPAQLADLVEAASHNEGEEIMRAVGGERGARGGRVRGARRPAPARVHRGALGRRGRGRARADGDRRRGRPARRPPRGAPRGGRAPAPRRPAPARARPGRLRPGHGRRPDEPRVRVPVRAGDQAGGDRADRAQPRAGRHAGVGVRDEPRPPSQGRDRARRPAARRPRPDDGRGGHVPAAARRPPRPSSRRWRG